MDKEGQVVPQAASAFRIGHVMLFEKEYPCKIVEMKSSKTGKHGSCKITFVGIDIFTGKKYREMSPSTHNMSAVIVKKEKFQILCVEDNVFKIIDDQDKMGPDIDCKTLSPQINKEIRRALQTMQDSECINVTVLSAMGKSTIQEYKVSPQSVK